VTVWDDAQSSDLLNNSGGKTRPAGFEPATPGLEGDFSVREALARQLLTRTATRMCHAFCLPPSHFSSVSESVRGTSSGALDRPIDPRSGGRVVSMTNALHQNGATRIAPSDRSIQRARP
jgi:hypothetical protein